MPNSRKRPIKPWLLWTLATLVVVAALGGIAFDVARRAGGMRVAATQSATLLKAPAGAAVKAVLRLGAPDGTNAYDAEILDGLSGTSYRGTHSNIRVVLDSDTSVVMGAGTDIKPGAVIQASGKMAALHTLRAGQIVILTGYVRIAP
jgi:hypothetical protein